MTVPCPYCGQDIELGIVHQGVSSSGVFQRVTIEATHPTERACPDFATKGADLVALANSPAAKAA